MLFYAPSSPSKALWFGISLAFSSFWGASYAQENIEKPATEAPTFSHESGFHPKPFNLTLSHKDPSVKIYYTLDGSSPDPDNLQGSTYQYKNEYAQPPNKPSGELLEATYQTHLYNKPILIRDRNSEANRIANISTTFDKFPDYFPKEVSNNWRDKAKFQLNKIIHKVNRRIVKINRSINKFKHKLGLFFKGIKYEHNIKTYIHEIPTAKVRMVEIPIYKGTPFRAIATNKDNVKSSVATKTFFIGNRDDFSLPVVNITVPEKELFDYNEGIFVAGKDYDEWLTSGEEVKGAAHQRPANWKRKGKNIQAHLSIHDLKDGSVVEQNIDIRLNGGGSRAMSNKTIRIYPRTKFSENGIDYPLFQDEKKIGLSRILLRNAGQHNKHTYLADAAIQRAMSHVNVGVQRYKPITVFINGEYYGVLNARDRHDKHYLAERFNLPNQKVDLLNNNAEPKQGDTEHWQKTVTFVKSVDKSSEQFFHELEKLIDIKSFIDYQSTEVFLANTDWPGNNIRYWRYRGSDKNSITKDGYTDGRWRWLLFDFEVSTLFRTYTFL